VEYSPKNFDFLPSFLKNYAKCWREAIKQRADFCPLLYIMWQGVLGWLLSTRGRECSAVAPQEAALARLAHPGRFFVPHFALARQLFLSQRGETSSPTASFVICDFSGRQNELLGRH